MPEPRGVSGTIQRIIYAQHASNSPGFDYFDAQQLVPPSLCTNAVTKDMSVGRLEAHCQQTLGEIVNISDRIRRTAALAYRASNQPSNRNFGPQVQEFRRQLGVIHTLSDTILEAITFDPDTLDDRIIDWLFSGELRSCLGRLKEMDDMLQSIGQVGPSTLAPVRSLRPADDKLGAVVAFFDKHKSLFHFLLTPDVWDRQRPLHQPSEGVQVDTLSLSTIGETQRASQETRAIRSGFTPAGHEPGDGRLLPNVGQTVTKKQKNDPRREMLDEVLRWLDALDCTAMHNVTHRLRQKGTCTWFPRTDAYDKWRSGGCHFLWLQGKAGCGKSVLIASTIEHLKIMLEDGEVLAFFYCDFRSERSTRPREVMRSILSQLIRHSRDRGVDPGDLPNKILQEKGEGTLLLNDLPKLCDLVSRAARCFDLVPIVVIDALDECADTEALVGALAMVEDDVRLLVTSRPYETTKRPFARLQLLSMENLSKEVAEDIELQITRELDSRKQLRSAGAQVRIEIHAILSKKADGRFRWVACQLDALKRCATRHELQEVLDNLPNELETTYERILEAIDERKSEAQLARRALTWLVVALEPLRLAQIVEGLLIDLQRANEHQTGSLGETLLLELSSLVSHCKETDVVALSHLSVKEFLTCHTTLPMYHVILHEAHAEVAGMCMRRISAFLKEHSSRRSVAPPMLSYVLSSGFNHLAHVDPASIVALEALQSLGSDIHHHPSHWERLCELRDEALRCPYPLWPSPRHDIELYILIAYSSAGLLRSFLSRRQLKPRIGTNPLVYAADLRKTGHAMVLLQFGADVNMGSLAIDDSHRALPLQVSVDRGNDVLVGEFLQRGCVVSSELLATTVCLPWCSTRVLVKLMQTDEFVEWAQAIGDEKLYRGVFSSARPDAGDSRRTDEDHVALACRLRQLGQDLSANSPFGAELVERAIHAAHTLMLQFLLPQDQPPSRFLLAASTGDTSETVPVVRFLLEKRVDIHAVSDAGEDSALHFAAMCPWEPRSLELTKLLLAAGCSPQLRNSRDETPFTIAVKRGHMLVAKALLSCDASLPHDILLVALRRRRNLQMIQWLLLRGANVNTVTLEENTVLHLAVMEFWEDYEDDDEDDSLEDYRESDRLDLVKCFIEAGCDPIACNSQGETVLEVAVEGEYTSVVEHLLSCNVPWPLPPDVLRIVLRRRLTLQMVESLICRGADVGFTTSNGDTVLHLAITGYPEPQCCDLVKTFIQAGCDFSVCNSAGKTVLEVAIEHGYTSVVDYLLSCNVPLPPDILLIALRQKLAFQMVKSLICKGANVHSTTSNGDTVLHLVVTGYLELQCCELVKIFIEAGCDPTTCNSAGKTVLEATIERGYTSVVDYLLSRNVPLPPDILLVFIALRRKLTLQMVELLICKGAGVKSNADTVLHLAINEYFEPQCYELVKTFIEAGCDPTTCDSPRKTVLEAAIERGYTSVVDYLLSCNVPLPPDILLTALRGKLTLQMVEFLICKGASVHSTTSNGDTVLHRAIAEYLDSSCLELIEAFIKAGCNPAACNSEGKTVLEAAMEEGYTLVVEYLLSGHVPLPPNILPIALCRCCTPQMIELLVRKGAHDAAISSWFDWDALLRLVHASYFGPDRQQVMEILDAAPNARTKHSDPEDDSETSIHAAKKPRLE